MLCTFCGKVIRLDMFRHVANFHLVLGQLWRCPVSWCTQWKGTPHDCIDHIRLVQSVSVTVKAGNLGRWLPPWTVTRDMWGVALKACSSLFPGCRRMHSHLAGVARPWYIAIVYSVGEERMPPYAGALCLSCGRSWWKQTLTDGWLANGTRNNRLRVGWILLCSAICVAGSQGMSPHVANLAGRCLHVPRHSPPPLRLLRLFRHRPSFGLINFV